MLEPETDISVADKDLVFDTRQGLVPGSGHRPGRIKPKSEGATSSRCHH